MAKRTRQTINDDTARWMGRIEERLDNLVDYHKQELENAESHRLALRDVIGALSGSVQALTLSVATSTRDINEIKPLVLDYRERRDHTVGAIKLSKALWAAIIGLAALIGAGVVELIKRLQH